MCSCRHTIQIKCTRSHPMMNSFLGACSQMHQPRICMHFFIQATLIHHVRTNVTIIRFKTNQYGNNLIMNLTFYLNNGCLMVHLHVIKCFIDPRNTLTNVPNCLCLLSTVDMRHATLMLWTISLPMLSTTSPTL